MAVLAGGGVAQDEGAPSAAEKDFLEFYYENPRPDRFVAQMKEWAADGTLDNEFARPALIAFVSQVIRANREELRGWYESLSGLTPGQMQVLLTGMLYSRTSEADEIMSEVFGRRYEEQKQETMKILEMPLDKRATLDMLWGFYYATGSDNAIRRIVTCFRFVDAPEKPDGVDVPQGFVPLYKELPSFAFGSLVDNAERHPRVVQILESLHENDKTLLRQEKDGIYDVLSEIRPDDYPPVDRSGKSV